MRVLRAFVVLLMLLTPQLAQAQEIWQTPVGRDCIEEWIADTTRRLNSFSGSSGFEGQKPWTMNQYGHFIGRRMTQNYEPDVWWSTFGGDKYHYMWGAVYQTEAQLPDWGNADFNGAEIFGMRWYTRDCVDRRGGLPPGPGPGPGPVPPAGGISVRDGYACFGDAVYPDIWRAEADCRYYGCYFGKMSRDSCIALGLEKGAREVHHGYPDRGRANECWLLDSCGVLRPNGDFTNVLLPAGPPPPPLPAGYSDGGNFACFGGASFPESWRTQARCVAYGCQFDRMELDSCLALGDRMGASLVIHGNPWGGRADECWLQNSCADMRPHGDFTIYQR